MNLYSLVQQTSQIAIMSCDIPHGILEGSLSFLSMQRLKEMSLSCVRQRNWLMIRGHVNCITFSYHVRWPRVTLCCMCVWLNRLGALWVPSCQFICVGHCSCVLWVHCFSNEQKQPWFDKDDTPENNIRARKAYEVLMTVTLLKPDSEAYRNFSQLVKRRAKQAYNYDYPGEEVSTFYLLFVLFFVYMHHMCAL